MLGVVYPTQWATTRYAPNELHLLGPTLMMMRSSWLAGSGYGFCIPFCEPHEIHPTSSS